MVKESEALWAIVHMDRPTSNDLAEYFDTSPGTARSTLRRLLSQGLVERGRRIDCTVGQSPYEYDVADMETDA